MDHSPHHQGFELVPKKINCFLTDILTTVAIIIESYGRQVPIYFSTTDDICNEIITDVEWVWQMLLNLLTNACKHTEEGSIHVNVSMCTAYPAGRKVKQATSPTKPTSSPCNGDPLEPQILFQIVDTGVGLGSATPESLFEVFSQAQVGQSSGTGLGLFSVYSRCQRLGGACGVISPNTFVEDKDGCIFWFTIPKLYATHQVIKTSDFTQFATSHMLCDHCQPDGIVVMGIDVPWKKPHNDGPTKTMREPDVSSDGSKSLDEEHKKSEFAAFTAFVVDDVQSIRKLLKRTLLGSLGFSRVETFENGKRALDAMKKEVVDVVFMNIQVKIKLPLVVVRHDMSCMGCNYY